MIKVNVFSKENCPLCDKGLAIIKDLKKEFTFEVSVIDIYQDDELLEKYQIMIPVITIDDDEIDFGQLSKEKIRKGLQEVVQKGRVLPF